MNKKTTYYAHNKNGRQKIDVENIFDVRKYIEDSSYYQSLPPHKISVVQTRDFEYPDDFI